MELTVVILAGGEGKRFKSHLPKVLHHLCGRPMVEYPLRASNELQPSKIIIVVSPSIKKSVQEYLEASKYKCEIVVQKEARGTGDAVLAARTLLSKSKGYTLILAGDVPMVHPETLREFVKQVQSSKGAGGVLTVRVENADGYGRIVRNVSERVARIVEHKDADERILGINEINTGVFCCDTQWLLCALKQIDTDNSQREYYLTDVARVASHSGEGLLPIIADDPEEFAGINSRVQLASVEACMRQRIIMEHMNAGVTFHDPYSSYIEDTVTISSDTEIWPMVNISGNSKIGENCCIEQGAIIKNSKIANGVHVKAYSVIEDALIANDCLVGPFARLRPGTRLDANVKVGNFVEIKQTRMKKNSKASHLSYLGDATIGESTNIGCGTITCNYDGTNKYQTIIGDGVFVGSDVAFVAPVKIGKDATIGAGSVVTENVPSGALALARGRQVNKKNWTNKKKRG